MNVHECFCLRGTRDNFGIDPNRDDEILFGPPEWADQIDRTLRRALMLNKSLRIVWWGDYGIGKTHRISHAVRHIRDKDMPFLPVRADCSDIQDKSGFFQLYYPLVNNLGAEFMHGIVEQFVLKMRQHQTSFKEWSDLAHSADVVGALKNFGSDNADNWRTAWQWLAGLDLKNQELKLAGVTKKQIDSSIEYAEALCALALILWEEKKKKLVYFVDQVERLSKITNANAQNTWVETLRAVLDVPEIGMVLAVGASRLDQIPAVVLAPEIASRFGKEAYEKHQLKAFDKDVTALFLRQLFERWIDPAKRNALAQEKKWAAPDYVPECYPFTKSAFETFCVSITHDPRDAKPRAFLERLNNVAAEACMVDKRLIDKTFLGSMGFSG